MDRADAQTKNHQKNVNSLKPSRSFSCNMRNWMIPSVSHNQARNQEGNIVPPPHEIKKRCLADHFTPTRENNTTLNYNSFALSPKISAGCGPGHNATMSSCY